MTPLYRYTIRTLDGQRHLVNATDSRDAIRKSGIAPELIRPFYPFCTGEAPEEKPKNKEGGKRLKQYRDELKASKIELDKERSTKEVSYAGGTNNLPLIPPACDCTENPCDKLHDRAEEIERQDEEIERQAEERDLLAPAVEHLATGEVQILLPTTPSRTIPEGALRPRKAQNDKPLALETVYIASSQGKLF